METGISKQREVSDAKASKKELQRDINFLLDDYFESRERSMNIAREFFGLGDGVIITEEELNDFVVFAKYSLKRVWQYMQSGQDGFVNKVKSIKAVTLEDIDLELKDNVYARNPMSDMLIIDNLGELALHDMSHMVGVLARHGFSHDGYGIAPILGRYDFEEVIKDENIMRKVFEEELFSGIFAYHYFSKNNLPSIKTFFNYVDLSMQLTLGSHHNSLKAYVEAQGILDTQGKNNNTYNNFIELEMMKAYKITEGIKHNLPVVFSDMMKFIYDNREDPRALVLLFFKYCGPFIQDLKQRKDRKYKVKLI